MRVDRTADERPSDPWKVVRHHRGRDRRHEVDAAAAAGIREALERRARVLAFPALAHELTLPPLRFPTPETWNGYIPPAMFNGQPNGSLLRSALILIVQTVAQAESEAAG